MSGDALESGVTIKAGAGYEASWLTPKGSPTEIKLWLMDFFGLTEDAVAGATPHEVVVMAEDIFQGRATVAQQLGGTLVTPATTPVRTEGNAWDDQADGAGTRVPAEPENPHAWLIEEFDKAKDEAALNVLWAKNKDAFSDETVKAAFVAKRESFKAAA